MTSKVNFFTPISDIVSLYKSLWKTSTAERRKTGYQLVIIPYKRKKEFVFNDSEWNFSLNYTFRHQLGLEYVTRQARALQEKYLITDDDPLKKSKLFSTWIQTASITFREGDSIPNKSDTVILHVIQGQPTGWDPDTNSMFLGNVFFKIFNRDGKKWVHISNALCSQLDFVLILKDGDLGRAKMLLKSEKWEG